jgi:post-segregation antitoxin (ccd killing protein)
MSTVSAKIPNSIHRQLAELARREGISIEQLVTAAIVEKASALMTLDYLEARGRRGSWEKFDAAMAKVPDVEPEERDRL